MTPRPAAPRLAVGAVALLAILAPMKTHASADTPPGLLSGHAPRSANPILPGYFADPSVVAYQGKHYIYATLDPWGDDTLGCWESADFANWTYRPLNWPTKAACTSPTSQGAKVWAPSVVRAADGRFFMYVSVGSEVWAGVADHPLGPWKNALGDRPLIPGNFRPGYHMIDAEAFIDDDGAAYLYWGSGWDWKNGRCFAVKLAPDMTTFDGEVRNVTPANYFEGPFMLKRGGRYHLTYSEGRTDRDTYEVRHAVGDTPFGPFVESPASPVLATDKSLNVISPGHHAIFTREGRDYIAYHRQSIPFEPGPLGRQLCVDELRWTADGLLEKVTPTHAAPAFLHDARARRAELPDLADPAQGATATASGSLRPHTGPERVLDDNYATRWAAPDDVSDAWLRLDLGAERELTRQELRLEYPWKGYAFGVETSLDGETWTPLHAVTADAPAGSPVVIERPVRARHLRLVFQSAPHAAAPSVVEWSAF